MIFSLENDGFSVIFTHNDKKLNRQTNYKKLYVYGSSSFLIDGLGADLCAQPPENNQNPKSKFKTEAKLVLTPKVVLNLLIVGLNFVEGAK